MDSWYSFCYAPVLHSHNEPDKGSYEEEFILWEDNDFGLCFEQLVIGVLSFTLLSLMSGFYFGIHYRFTRRKTFSLGPCLKVLITFVLLINSVVQLAASFWLVHHQPYAILLSHSVEVVCWSVHFLCLIILACSVLHIGYGPLPLNLIWGLSLLFSILRFRTAIQYIRYPYLYNGREPNPLGYLALPLQVNSYVRFGFQTLYFFSLLMPARRETRAGLLFSIEQSSTQETDRVPLLLGSKKGAEIVSSEDIDYGSVQSEKRRIRLTLEDNANPFSLLSFWWLTSLMQRGAKGFLQSPADLPILPRSLSTTKIRIKFQNILRRDQYVKHDSVNGNTTDCTLRSLDRLSQYSSEQNIPQQIINGDDEDEPYYTLSSSNHHEDPRLPESHPSSTPFSLIRSLNRAFGLHFYPLGLMKLASDCLGFAGPLLLHQLVGFMENRKVHYVSVTVHVR